MSDHTHRILRNWRKKVTSTSYSTIWSESVTTFFGANKIIGSDKWTAYGMIEGVLVRPSTGGNGQRLTFLVTKAPNSSSMVLMIGSLRDIVGDPNQFINARISGEDLIIEGKLNSDNGSTGILSITLDLHLVGGTGPVS